MKETRSGVVAVAVEQSVYAAPVNIVSVIMRIIINYISSASQASPS